MYTGQMWWNSIHWKLKLTVRSKQDISPSEGHFRLKTIMAAILKCRSKPKCSKLATSNGPSVIERYRCWTLWPPMILSADSLHDDGASLWWRRTALQETVVWSPTPFNPSKLSLRRVNPLKGLGHRDEPFRMEHRVILLILRICNYVWCTFFFSKM